MKRLMSLLCVLIVIVSVAIPVSASDYNYFETIDLLALQEDPVDFITVPANSTYDYILDVEKYWENFGYVEVTFYGDYDVSINGHQATIITTSGRKIAYTSVLHGLNELKISFTNNYDYAENGMIFDVRYSSSLVTPENVPFVANFHFYDIYDSHDYDFYSSFTFNDSSTMIWDPISQKGQVYAIDGGFVVDQGEVLKYDALSLSFDCAFPITQIGVYTNQISVPYDIKVFSPVNEVVIEYNGLDTYTSFDLFSSSYTYSLYIDLTSIALVNRGDLIIDITCAEALSYEDYFIKTFPMKGFFIPDEEDINVVWYRRLLNALKELISGNSQQNSAAEEFNQEMQEQAEQIDQMNQVMDSVDKPAASDIQMDLNDTVSSSSVMLATQGLSHALSETYILKILIMAMTFALIGFVLYGKR